MCVVFVDVGCLGWCTVAFTLRIGFGIAGWLCIWALVFLIRVVAYGCCLWCVVCCAIVLCEKCKLWHGRKDDLTDSAVSVEFKIYGRLLLFCCR